VLRPPVGGSRRDAMRPLGALSIGTLAGGLLLALVLVPLQVATSILPNVRAGLLLAISSLSLVAIWSAAVRGFLPARACQVRKEFLDRYGADGAALRWGVELGAGVFTHSVTPALYSLIVVAVCQRTIRACVAVCAVYGVARGLTISTQAVGQPRPAIRRLPAGQWVRTTRIPLGILVLMTSALLVAPTEGLLQRV
jgi:hypothetical protein